MIIYSSRNKIRLSRNLTAQTTPYPHIHAWIKRGFFIVVLVMAAGIYLATRPENNTAPLEMDKEILGEQQPTTELIIYEIKSGDTLFNVSRQHGISWQTLAEINSLQEPYVLKVGQRLKIPASPAGGPKGQLNLP